MRLSHIRSYTFAAMLVAGSADLCRGGAAPPDELDRAIRSAAESAASRMSVEVAGLSGWIRNVHNQRGSNPVTVAGWRSEGLQRALREYLTAKLDAIAQRTLRQEDIADINFNALHQNARFLVVRVYVTQPTRIVGAATRISATENRGYRMYDVNLRGGAMNAVVVPVAREGDAVTVFTETTDTRRRAICTIALPVGSLGDEADGPELSSLPRVVLRTTERTRGCEVHIISEPAGASVYFNGRRHYRKTPCQVLRSPDECEVRIRASRREPITLRRRLRAGYVWLIYAKLPEPS